MKRRRLGAIGGFLIVAAVAVWAIAGSDDRLAPRPLSERPALALLTSLPLMFGESFGIEGGGSPAMTRLEQRYQVEPIGIADAASLKGQKLLLMAHPRAQPAEVLVELDRWVRDGGRLLLLADPRLDWPSRRPLGDRLRPPPGFADTGLLMHWGLALDGPKPESPRTVGRLSSSSRCKLYGEGIVARCPIGRGSVTVIADADFLNVDSHEDEKLDLLVDELARLESR